MADYKVIRTTVVTDLTRVRLYDETIEKVKRGHPEVHAELPSIVAAVTNAVANPTHVERSYGGSYVYVDSASTNASGDPLRVPVKRIEKSRKSGRVRSFYFASTTTGEDDIIWRKPDDQD